MAAPNRLQPSGAARLCKQGGRLLLKQHAPDEGTRHGTTPLAPEEIAELFRTDFDLVSVTPSALDGTLDPPPRALFAKLTRR